MEGILNFAGKYGSEILIKSREHLLLTFTAMLIACLIAVPLGIALTRLKVRLVVNSIIGLVNLIQPIPSLAVVALTAALFVYIHNATDIYLPTIGKLPAMVALVAYALLPILRNTYTGIKQVDKSIVEAARGMGMRDMQILVMVELPLTMPVIMAGIKTSTVWTIGVTALVSLVGAGGLGDLIFKGLSNYQISLILAGAVPAALLALVFDWILGMLEKWMTPGR